MTSIFGNNLKAIVSQLFWERLKNVDHFWHEYDYLGATVEDLLLTQLKDHHKPGSVLVFTCKQDNYEMLMQKYAKYQCCEIVLCENEDEIVKYLSNKYPYVEESSVLDSKTRFHTVSAQC